MTRQCEAHGFGGSDLARLMMVAVCEGRRGESSLARHWNGS